MNTFYSENKTELSCIYQDKTQANSSLNTVSEQTNSAVTDVISE